MEQFLQMIAQNDYNSFLEEGLELHFWFWVLHVRGDTRNAGIFAYSILYTPEHTRSHSNSKLSTFSQKGHQSPLRNTIVIILSPHM